MAFVVRSFPLITSTIRRSPIINQAHKIHRWVAPTMRAFTARKRQLIKKNGPTKPNPRNTYLEWNLESELYAFSHRINEVFNSDLLLQAFTDRSYVIKEEMKQKEVNIDLNLQDNRKLAEKGEEFINKYIQKYLEYVLPKLPIEGIVSIRNHLTSEKVLAHTSSHIGTTDIILADEYPVNNSQLACTFKAIVGALLESSGEKRTAHFVRDILITQLQGEDVMDYWPIEDPWTTLTALINKSDSELEPRLIGDMGKNTLLACYRVGLYLDKHMMSSGFGETIAIAKEMAALEALRRIFGTEENMHPINFQIDELPKQTAVKRCLLSAN